MLKMAKLPTAQQLILEGWPYIHPLIITLHFFSEKAEKRKALKKTENLHKRARHHLLLKKSEDVTNAHLVTTFNLTW